MEVPEVHSVGRRTGRAELDEHAEGVHVSELDVDLKPSRRSREQVLADIRARLSALPVSITVGQPIAHRLDHMLSGVRAQLVIKIYGDDFDTLRGLAADLEKRLAPIKGLVDLQVEKQVRIPQLQVRVDYDRAAKFGLTPAAAVEALRAALQRARRVADRRREPPLRCGAAPGGRRPDARARLFDMLVETPAGRVPLGAFAPCSETDGPNQILREDGRRRIALLANTDGSDMARIVDDIRTVLAERPLPQGYFTRIEGQFQAQESATRLIGLLSLVSLAMIFVVLYSRYQSAVLALIIMGNVPLALIGGVIALWVAGQPLSVASAVGFITLAGIATRNGILKVSHYINLVLHEGERFGPAMVIRGTLERLTPVLMTALAAGIALVPLMIGMDEPGKEILSPVAVTIFGGLVSATLLDAFLTPTLFLLFGEQAARASRGGPRPACKRPRHSSAQPPKENTNDQSIRCCSGAGRGRGVGDGPRHGKREGSARRPGRRRRTRSSGTRRQGWRADALCAWRRRQAGIREGRGCLRHRSCGRQAGDRQARAAGRAMS